MVYIKPIFYCMLLSCKVSHCGLRGASQRWWGNIFVTNLLHFSHFFVKN
jgi:hypothetical protein